jgi:hypothetical protein
MSSYIISLLVKDIPSTPFRPTGAVFYREYPDCAAVRRRTFLGYVRGPVDGEFPQCPEDLPRMVPLPASVHRGYDQDV